MLWKLKCPYLCNTYSSIFRRKMYKTVKIEKDENFAKYIKEQWKRFLDGCFIFWERSMTDFTYFESVLNSSHPDIKFKVLKSFHFWI